MMRDSKKINFFLTAVSAFFAIFVANDNDRIFYE